MLRRVAWLGVGVLVMLVACSGGGNDATKNRERATDATPATQVTPPTTTAVSHTQPPTALVAPPNVTLCRAEQIDYAGGTMGTFLLRFFNRSGRPCGLAGYAEVLGRQQDGAWTVIPTMPKSAPAVLGAPSWTGVWDPAATMAIQIENPSPSRYVNGQCPQGEVPVTHFDALRLVLPAGAGSIDLPAVFFDIGPCHPTITTFAYDSSDA